MAGAENTDPATRSDCSDFTALADFEAVRAGTATVAVTITVHGEISAEALQQLDVFLTAVTTIPIALVVDLWRSRGPGMAGGALPAPRAAPSRGVRAFPRAGADVPGRDGALHPTGPVTPALHSYWLANHVTTMTVASGILLFAGVASALFLLRIVHDRTPTRLGWTARLPGAKTLDRVAYRATAVAFPIFTFATTAGAIWAEAAWGRYWGWDPKETTCFVAWVVYAGYLHARSTAGWRGRRAATVNVAGWTVMIFSVLRQPCRHRSALLRWPPALANHPERPGADASSNPLCCQGSPCYCRWASMASVPPRAPPL